MSEQNEVARMNDTCPSAGSVWIAYTPQTNNLCSIACSPMLFREREQALEFVEKLTNQNEKWLIEQVTVSTPNATPHLRGCSEAEPS